MKTLVIVTHPNIEESSVNKRWMEELEKYPEKFTVHQLYKAYPDEKIDILKEQRLIESYDKIVFQFPMYWYNSPPLLKKWFDEVFLYGWAYGSKSGYKVAGKKMALAVSVGSDEEGYSASGENKFTIKELMNSFEASFNYVKADYKGLFAHYDVVYNTSEDWVEKSIPMYLDFVKKI